MASLVTDENFSISEFYELLLDQLPKYSIPVFLRISPEIEITGTFKYKKTDLVKDGFDPNTISDELYFADVLTNQYIKLDADLFQKIHNQEVRI
jgi:fatty-acyl-CoA synthase